MNSFLFQTKKQNKNKENTKTQCTGQYAHLHARSKLLKLICVVYMLKMFIFFCEIQYLLFVSKKLNCDAQ